MMEATARQTVLHNTIYKLKKRLPLSAHDRRKSLYQAVSAHLLTSNSAGAAYLHCIKDGTNIDPACGSGSLLLKFAKILGKENVRLGFFGQEINITTYNLCRINMFLHDIDYDKFDIGHGDTLTNPLHWDDEPFEAIVSNPPYSIKWEGKDNPLLIDDPRFSPAGVLAPKSKADLAFIMHSLSWLATSGTAAIVCFPGVMYRGGTEKKIRKYLIDNNYIDCIIQLPDNLFYGTSIATCLMVLKKSKTENSTLFIDASKEFVKVTNSNKLTPDNIKTIVAAFTERKDKEYFARVVPNAMIAEQDYNLSVSTYVEQEDTREIIDIVALNKEIEEIVAREQMLREEIAKIITEIELPSAASADRQGKRGVGA
jgi:type I restriction enzyme M protein